MLCGSLDFVFFWIKRLLDVDLVQTGRNKSGGNHADSVHVVQIRIQRICDVFENPVDQTVVMWLPGAMLHVVDWI